MALPAGTRFGPYEIRALIGSGGMGEVYRATDTRLGRDVAIKTLRAGTTSRDRLDRFEQEARATAALNHPNIVVVFDVGIFDGAPYVVSELLDGLTIRERIRHGEAVPVRTAIDYCQQIARGLAVAHTRGIAHRDLKPENVFVTRDGLVKILDFGLAKLTEPSPARTDPAGVLETHVETQPGIVLGSIGYMAPEQVRGLEADHRCDVFSLGAILYELLSGQRAFRGETRADVMTAILREDPPELVDKHIPPGLVRIVARCLEKAPERRFQSASDLGFALEALSSPSGSDHGIAARAIGFSHAGWRWTWILAIAAAIVVGAGLAAWSLFDRIRNDREQPLLARFQVTPPEGSRLVALEPTPIPRFALSLDGKSVAFVAQTGDRTHVWVRPVDSLQQTMVPGTEGAVGSPFWAPDGQSLAFFTSRSLKAVDLTRAASRTICEGGFFSDAEGTWGDDGTILGTVTVGGFGTTFFVVPSTGGACEAHFFQMGSPPPTFIAARQPQLLPGGRHFIFSSSAPNADHTGVFVGSVPDGKVVMRVIAASPVAAYAAGHLLFIQDGILMAQRFDALSLRLSGQPRPVTRSVEFSNTRSVRLAASLGTLAYATAGQTQSELVWVDRKGAMVGSVGLSREWGDFDLAPDDRQVAVIGREPTLGRQEVWSIDLADGTRKVLSPRSVAGVVDRPRWSPDGRTLAFTRSLPDRTSVVLAPADGGPSREILVESAQSINLLGWSSDEKSVVYLKGEALLAVPTTGDPKPAPLVGKPSGLVGEPRLSPDGRSLAYASIDADLPQIYVTSIPAPSERLAISPRGLDPRYRRDGRELFYRSIQGDLMAVDMRPGATATAREPRVLFRLDRGVREYAASSDGQRFLLKRLIEGPAPTFTMLINWRQEVND